MAARNNPPLSWSLVATLAWFGLRGRPLTRRELSRLLLGNKADEVKVREEAAKDSRIVQHDEHYALKDDEVRAPSPAALRNYRYKWWRLQLAVSLLRHLPFVRMVCALQTMNDRTVTAPHDIDVLVIVKEKRLFLTRTLITLVLQLAGLRRHGRKITNRICLSWYATTDHLDMSPVLLAPYDILLTFLFAEMTPVLDHDATYEKFVASNPWLQEQVPGYEQRNTAATLSRVALLGEYLLGGKAGDFLEKMLQRWQLGRINRNKERPDPDVEIIAHDRMLKFHEKDRRRTDRQQWEERMKKLGVNPDLIR